MKKVTVKYIYGGKIDERDSEVGILLGNKVLVTGGGEIGLYDVTLTEDEGVVIIDLDNNAVQHLHKQPDMLINLLSAV
ncbi:hypothetical protein MHI57_10765 [Cytobacillus sp. FSL K6-0129]|uniref:hypothetical protein n=1 Tax=Cytobacillus sp. FSL K6-0129 TaxID=2921421 RepID=UPI0030F51939